MQMSPVKMKMTRKKMMTYRNEPTTLSITSDFTAEANAPYKSNEVILDSGASQHFSPNCSKLINYTEINPEPIKAADGHTFNALRKGDMNVKLPSGNQKTNINTAKKCLLLTSPGIYTNVSFLC